MLSSLAQGHVMSIIKRSCRLQAAQHLIYTSTLPIWQLQPGQFRRCHVLNNPETGNWKYVQENCFRRLTPLDFNTYQNPSTATRNKWMNMTTGREIGGAASGATDIFTNDAMARCMHEGPGKIVVSFPEDGVAFSSRFDGGSLAHVERVRSNEFLVTIPEDASESGVSTGYTSWFYLEAVVVDSETAVRDRPEAAKTESKRGASAEKMGGTRELTIVLANMNNQRGLFASGYTVMYSAMDASRGERKDDVELFFENERKWMRVPTPISVEKYTHTVAKTAIKIAGGNNTGGDEQEDEAGGGGVKVTAQAEKTETKMRLTFTHHVQFAHERVRFAFCYPYTYTKVQRQLTSMDAKLTASGPASDIYYHRDVLTHSLGGIPIELVTISSRDSMLETPEPSLPSLYPAVGGRASAFDLRKKRTVFITARVHPGETPANFMLDGMLRLLSHPTDENAIALRRQFVFKIVPVLNPDGVCQGYYRTDSRGVNLNRVYESPQLSEEPAIFAVRELLLRTVERYGHEKAKESVVYLDLHAHSNHRGCFVYGNSLLPIGCVHGRDKGLSRQIQTQLFAKLASLHSPFFDYGACSFAAENMTRRDARDNNNATTSREGSSRVALFRATDLTYVYTIECNYNEGRRRLEGSMKQSTRPKSEPPQCSDRISRHAAPLGGRMFIKYSPAEWIDVGIGCLVTLLDLFQLSPGRRPMGSQVVADSPYRTLDAVKKSIQSDLKAADLLAKETAVTQPRKGKSQSATKMNALKTTASQLEPASRTSKSASSRSIVSKY